MCIGFSSSVHGSTADTGLFHFMWHKVNSASILRNPCKFDGVFVFAATLLLVTFPPLSGTQKIVLPGLYSFHMTSILEGFCDAPYHAYGRKTCLALSSKVSAPIILTQI